MKKHSHYTNYQESALRFQIGDIVRANGLGIDNIVSGEVVAVFPAIGMVDVQYPNGVKRYPVDEIDHVNKRPFFRDDLPSGGSNVSLPNGPSARKVASEYLKKIKR